MRLRYRILIFAALAILYLGFEGLWLLDAFAAVMMGAFCDNCSPAEIDAVQRPLTIWFWQFVPSLIVIVVAGGWWLFAPRRRAQPADAFE